MAIVVFMCVHAHVCEIFSWAYISTSMLAVIGCMFAFEMEADGDDSHLLISVMENRRDIARRILYIIFVIQCMYV